MDDVEVLGGYRRACNTAAAPPTTMNSTPAARSAWIRLSAHSSNVRSTSPAACTTKGSSFTRRLDAALGAVVDRRRGVLLIFKPGCHRRGASATAGSLENH